MRDKTDVFGALSWTRTGSICVWDRELRPVEPGRTMQHDDLKWIGDLPGYAAAMGYGGDDAIRILNLADGREVTCFRVQSPNVVEFVAASLGRSEPLIVVGTVTGAVGILRYVRYLTG